MNKKLLTTLPVLTILTACGGGSIGGTNFEQLQSAIQNEVLQNAPAGSIGLKAGETVKVNSNAAVIAVDFDKSEVGSAIKIIDGDLAGLEITKVISVGEKPTLTFSQPGSTETVSEFKGSVNTILQAAAEFMGVDGVETFTIQNINGTDVYFQEIVNESATTKMQGSAIGIDGTQGSVEATLTEVEIGDDTSIILGVKREVEGEISPNYEAPTAGNFLYAGISSVFDDEQDYSSETATMEVNFEDLTGTFSASGFEPDEGGTAKIISIESALKINNTTGTISSTSGIITVDGVSGDIGVNGMLAFDNNAAAGTLIPTAEVDGIAGGIFVLPRTQP